MTCEANGTYDVNADAELPMMVRVEQNKKSLKLIAVPPVSHSIGPKDSKIPKFSILGAGFALPISLFVCME